jgi:tRNA U54 and U55 pseudouridine synthase Pus10
MKELEIMIKLIQEIKKHAEKDDCYSCKQLLKEGFVEQVSSVLENVKK